MRLNNLSAVAAALLLCAVPSLAQAQCRGGMQGSGGMGMGGQGMGMNAGLGGGMGTGQGRGMNAMMMQRQLQQMQQQMMQMQQVQQAMLERMEEMSGRSLNAKIAGRRSSSTRTADASRRKSATAKRTYRSTKPKSTESSDDNSILAASERPARRLRPASE